MFWQPFVEMRKASSMEVSDLAKSLRGNLADLPSVCSHEKHEELLRDILQKTPRLNKEEAVRGLRKAFPGAETASVSAFAASMVVCVQSVFAKLVERSCQQAWCLIAVADELYPVSGREQTGSAPSMSSSTAACASGTATPLPVATSKVPSRQLKEDSIVSVSSAASCGQAMRIATPPRASVPTLYRPDASEHVYYTDAGRQTMVRILKDRFGVMYLQVSL